jgi:hypothetical protein
MDLRLIPDIPEPSEYRATEILGIDLGTQHFRIAQDLELQRGGDGRTIVGYAVPFNKPQRINATLTEAFDPHSVDHQLRAMHRVDYYNLHSVHNGVKVGHIKYARAEPTGLYTESYISPDDPAGDQTLDEIRSGVKPQQSVGFEAGPGGTQMRDGVAVRTKVHLFELAAVPQGAYGSAASISGVRAAVCPECGFTPGIRSAQDVAALIANLPTL